MTLSNHEKILLPNFVFKINIPNNNCRLIPHNIILGLIAFLLLDNKYAIPSKTKTPNIPVYLSIISYLLKHALQRASYLSDSPTTI